LYEVRSTHLGGRAKYKEPRAKKQEDLLQIGIDYNFFAPWRLCEKIEKIRRGGPAILRGRSFREEKSAAVGTWYILQFFAQQKSLNLHNKNS
jgi:hypothetical protein